MDIDNYQRLQIAQTYFDNRDAGGNIRYWRPQTPGGRWRWILYDVEPPVAQPTVVDPTPTKTAGQPHLRPQLRKSLA